MRLLVVGCGGIGGYFGGRLAEAGVDVTFLVRPPRAEQLKAHGLKIISHRGDVQLAVKTAIKTELKPEFDLILLTCKSYHLSACLDEIEPVVGPQTLVLPLLNGLDHYHIIQARLGREKVVFGFCNISAGLGQQGEIVHYNTIHEMTLGIEPSQDLPIGLDKVLAVLQSASFVVRNGQDVWQELWEKFVFINALAAATTLMKANIGQIMATRYGRSLISTIVDECQAIAVAAGFPVRKRADKMARDAMLAPGSEFSASMLKDMQAGRPVEHESLLGDLIRRARSLGITAPLLEAAYCHLQIYEQQRILKTAA